MASQVLYWGLPALAVTLTGCYPSAAPSIAPSEITDTVEESLIREAEPDAPRQATVLEPNDSLAGKPLSNFQVTHLVAQDPDTQINIRADPNVDAAVIDGGGVGEEVEVLRVATADDDHDWYYIQTDDESSGWVRSDFVEPIRAVTGPVITDQAGEDILTVALDRHCGGSQSIAAYYQTESFLVYVCMPGNRPIYLGHELGAPQVLVTDDVQPLAGANKGYTARQDNYEYRITDTALTVYKVDDQDEFTLVLQEQVTTARHYQ
jgi:hypothetical protein